MSSQPAITLVFWVSISLVAYTYLLYPAVLAVWARFRSVRSSGHLSESPYQGSFSVVICAHNEAERIMGRLEDLAKMAQASHRRGEIILVSDGSTDDTVCIARTAGGGGIRVLEIPAQGGKAAALTLGSIEARGDVLVFADVRQRWAPDALDRLLDNFSRPGIGAVSGELVLESSPGSLAGIGLYWRYEKWIRQKEAVVHSVVGVTGAISAVRRELFKPIPPGIVLDDVYWPMQVVLMGGRVVHDHAAVAFDTLPPRPHDELRRKIRTLSGNFQLMAAMPATLSPLRNPVWLQFISHKALRLAVPWLLIALLMTSATLNHLIYRVVFWAQLAFYGVAALALTGVLGFRSQLCGAVSSFVLLNVAAWVGFWVWVTGTTKNSWNKTPYQAAKSPAPRSKPIRIAYVIDTFMIGGTELNAIRTLEALDLKRFYITVFHFGEHGPLRARYEAIGVRMVHLPISGFRSMRTLLQGVRFGILLRRMDIRVVHSHDVYTNIFAAPWARTVGHCRVITSRRWLYDVPRPALNPLNRLSYRFAHRVLANSGSVVRVLIEQEGIAREKIAEIPNFLSKEAFELEIPQRRDEQRRLWGVPDGAFVVGVVARLAAVKNHAMLLRAVHALLDDTHIVLIGDGPERKHLEVLAGELAIASRVHFVGTVVSQVNPHQFFDVSVLCSRSEGFPNTIIEALAVRRPVVATIVGGVGDAVEHGTTGLLVDSEDVRGLTDSLRKLRFDPDLGARLGAAGERCVRAKYSQDVVVSKLEDLYIELTGKCFWRARKVVQDSHQ